MKNNRLYMLTFVFLFGLCLLPGMLSAQTGNKSDWNHIMPLVIDDVFDNPGKGFMTFQRFNGDTLNPRGWTEGYPIEYQDFDGNVENENHPQTSIAYFRIYWRYVEPEQGQYDWDMIDKALKTARERGQKLLLRIAPHGRTEVYGRADVPEWYREMVGNQTEWAYDSEVNGWMVDANDPRYVEHFGGMIRALGERYDGHPDLENMDLSTVGSWGEGAGSSVLTREAREGLINAYTDTFKKTPLLMLLHGKESVAYAASQANVGWRQDCLGDLDFWADEEGRAGWSHMYDYYPRTIIEYDMQDAWKKAPVSFEICYTFNGWKERGNYGLEEVQYILDRALTWRISTFNAKSSPVPEEWEEVVDEWIKKMGYRFVLGRFSYPKEVNPGGMLNYNSWWENKGVAPIYQNYPLAFRLINDQTSMVLFTDLDIRDWMPGDHLYDDSVLVPEDMPAGEYKLELALVNPITNSNEEATPAIKLAIDGITEDGWYSLGDIVVTD